MLKRRFVLSVCISWEIHLIDYGVTKCAPHSHPLSNEGTSFCKMKRGGDHSKFQPKKGQKGNVTQLRSKTTRSGTVFLVSKILHDSIVKRPLSVRKVLRNIILYRVILFAEEVLYRRKIFKHGGRNCPLEEAHCPFATCSSESVKSYKRPLLYSDPRKVE